MSTFEKIRINEIVPEQLRETAKNLIDFLKVYYSEDDNPTSYIEFLTKNRDVDQLANTTFLNALAQTVAPGVPDSSVVEKTFLLKRLVDYYNLKGTDRSIVIFFQLFYDKLVEVTYPWERVLETSSARFTGNQTLRIIGNSNTDPYELVGKQVEQKTSFGLVRAQAKVERVTIEQFDETFFVLHFSEGTIFGTFVEKENITYNNIAYGTAYKSLQEIKINSGGKGFEIGDILFLDYQPLTTFKAKVISTGVF